MAHLWRCVKITCKARCTDIEDTIILVKRFDHDHNVEEEERTVKAGTETDMQAEGSNRIIK